MIVTNISMTERLVHSLGWTLLHSLWQATVIALMVAAIYKLLPRMSARGQYRLALLGLLAAALTNAATFGDHWRALSPIAVLHNSNAAALWSPAPAAGELAWLSRNLTWLVVLWLCGCAIMATRHGLAYWYSRRLVAGTSVAPAELTSRLDALKRRAELTQAVRLGIHPRLSSPCVVGWLKPWILLPAAALARLPADELEAALAHELWHIKRRDYPVQLAQAMLTTVYFFNPAVLWLSRRADWLREHACDDGAVAITANPRALAAALAFFAGAGDTATGANLIPARFSTLERIKRILAPPPRRCRPFEALAASVGALLLGAVISVNAAQRDDLAERVETLPLGPFEQLTDGEARALIDQGLQEIYRHSPLTMDLPTWQSPSIVNLPTGDRAQLNTALLTLLRDDFESAMGEADFYQQLSPDARQQALDAIFDSLYTKALTQPAKRLLTVVNDDAGIPLAQLEQFGHEQAYKITLFPSLLDATAETVKPGFSAKLKDRFVVSFALTGSQLDDTDRTLPGDSPRYAGSWAVSYSGEAGEQSVSAYADKDTIQLSLAKTLYAAVRAEGFERDGGNNLGLRRQADGALAAYIDIAGQQQFSRRMVQVVPDSAFKAPPPDPDLQAFLAALPAASRDAVQKLADEFVVAQQWLSDRSFGPQQASIYREVFLKSQLEKERLAKTAQTWNQFMAFPGTTSALAYGPAGGQLQIRARSRPLSELLAELENQCGAPLPNPWQNENPQLNIYLEQVPCVQVETILTHLHQMWSNSTARQ